MPNKQHFFDDLNGALARLASEPWTDEERAAGVKRLALSLSGGGASGAFEAGVLEELFPALEAWNTAHPADRLEIGAVIGTSTGALNTYGLLCQFLHDRCGLPLPNWLGGSWFRLLNARIWNCLSSRRTPAKVVIDKPWLLKAMQGAWGTIRSTLVLLGALLGLSTAALVPFVVAGLLCAGSYGTWAAWPAGLVATALGIVGIGIVLLGWTAAGGLRFSGRPYLATAGGILFAGGLLAAARWAALQLLPLAGGPPALPDPAAVGTLDVLTTLSMLAASVGVLWQVNNRGLFDNGRLLRFLSALVLCPPTDRGLDCAVRRAKAEQHAAEAAGIVSALVRDHADSLPTFVVTATDVTGERQGLFFLGRPEDAVRLAAEDWLVLDPVHGTPGTGVVAVDRSFAVRGTLVSSSIPDIYPAQPVDIGTAGKPLVHLFVDGGVRDFAPFNVAIDLGYNRVLSVETAPMTDREMERQCDGKGADVFTVAYRSLYTAVDVAARDEAAHVAQVNQLVKAGPGTGKRFVALVRIAPALDERMVSSEELNGRYVKGTLRHSLADWIQYGRCVDPDRRAALAGPVWYDDPVKGWTVKQPVYGPLLWDASEDPAPARGTTLLKDGVPIMVA